MAYASGTCTDFIDFLRKLKGYAVGTVDPATDPSITSGIVVPVGDRWTALTLGGGMTALPGSGSATDGEFYLQGAGSDPADQIMLGFQTYRNAGNNVYGFRMRGYTAYNSALTYSTMPGTSLSVHTALANSSFSCWFWVTSRRIMAVARIGTTDILIYAGFVQQFGTRSQYPYPLMISGSVIDTTYNTAQNNFGQSCLPDPAVTSCYIRWVDGTWNQIAHYSGGGATRSQARTVGPSAGFNYAIWPLRDWTSTDGAEQSVIDNAESLFETFSSTNRQLSSSEISAYPLFPCLVHGPTQLIAQVEGLYTIPGLGLNSGDTVSDGTYTYDIFKNTWRSETADFYAVRRV